MFVVPIWRLWKVGWVFGNQMPMAFILVLWDKVDQTRAFVSAYFLFCDK